MDGADSVKIHGRYVQVRAEVCDLSGFSVHADGSELIDWLRTATREPSGVFVVHGEERASLALRRRIHDELGWNAVVPQDGERLALTPVRPPSVSAQASQPARAGEPEPAMVSTADQDVGMAMSDQRARNHLVMADHGVLATVDPDRGVHSVPVCFALVGDRMVVPIDRVKPKSSTDLRRTDNLELDPRATLLCDHWDRHDWHQLWWVRADLHRCPDESVDTASLHALGSALRERYPQYRTTEFARLLVFEVVAISGWAAAG
jgi:PPOX class probable F420-dependent enzyme